MNYGRVWQLQSSTLLLCCIFSALLCWIFSALCHMRAPPPFILSALETREQIWKQIPEKYVLVRRIGANFGGGKGRMDDTELGCGCLRCIPVVVCEDINILVIMSRYDSDDDLFFGRSRAEELSAVTVRELGRSSSSSSSSQGCLSSRAAELSACRSRDQLTKLPTDTAAWLHS